jgi:hypothetical protein
MVKEGRYRDAYQLAIRESLLPTLSRPDLESEIFEWVANWTAADEEEVSVQDLLSEFDRIMNRKVIEIDLSIELEKYCKDQKLPFLSADEVLLLDGVTEEQILWLSDFITRWDEATK